MKSTTQVIWKFLEILGNSSQVVWKSVKSTTQVIWKSTLQVIWKLQLFLENYISNSISACAGHQQKILEMNFLAFQQVYFKLTESLSK